MNVSRLDREGDYVRLPRNRKITLSMIIAFTFITLILLIVTMIRPVPQYSASGALMQLQAQDSETFSKRSLMPSIPSDTLSVDSMKPVTSLTSPEQLSSVAARAIFKHELWKHQEEDCRCSTGRPDLTSTPTRTTSMATPTHSANATTSLPDTVSIDKFVAMWIGILGVCLQRAAGTLVCTGSSVLPNYEAIYEQSGLSDEIRAVLPQSTNGASLGLLFGTLCYGVCLLAFGISILPSFYTFTPFGPAKSLDSHHQWTLSFSAIVAASALIATLVSTIVMRNQFSKTVKAIPAIDPKILTSLGSAFKQLYGIAVLGGLILVASMSLIAEDARYPWWFQADRLAEGPAGQQLAPPLDFSARRPANPFGGPVAGLENIGGAATAFGGFQGAATPALGGPMSFAPTPARGAMSFAPTSVM